MAENTNREKLRELRSHLVKALDTLSRLGTFRPMHDPWKVGLVEIKRDVEKNLGE